MELEPADASGVEGTWRRRGLRCAGRTVVQAVLEDCGAGGVEPGDNGRERGQRLLCRMSDTVCIGEGPPESRHYRQLFGRRLPCVG